MLTAIEKFGKRLNACLVTIAPSTQASRAATTGIAGDFRRNQPAFLTKNAGWV
jgi:hypothetical protein